MTTRTQRHSGVRVDCLGIRMMLVETEIVRFPAYDTCVSRSVLRTLFEEWKGFDHELFPLGNGFLSGPAILLSSLFAQK